MTSPAGSSFLPFIRIGDTYRVPTVGLLEFLGLAPDEQCRSPADPARLTVAVLELFAGSKREVLMGKGAHCRLQAAGQRPLRGL